MHNFLVIPNEVRAEHQVGCHKLISSKCEWNNCIINYQTLAFVMLRFEMSNRVNNEIVYYYWVF